MGQVIKETPTYIYTLELEEDSILDGPKLVNQMIALALLTRPYELRVQSGESFRLSLEAKGGYKPDDFFEREQAFMDEVGPDEH